MWILQIIHNPLAGGENIIETAFDKRFSAEAEQRRHGKMKHTQTRCETYVIWEADRAITDAGTTDEA